MQRFTRWLAVAVLTCSAAWAHYTWVSAVEFPLEVGKTAAIRINHGHRFPQSEEAINVAQVELFVLPPSGKRTELQTQVTPTAITSSYAVKEAGEHRIVLLQDRGVSSRTPKGVRPGGKDQNPDALQSSRTLRTAVAYAATSKGSLPSGTPVGLEIELTGKMANGAWHLQLLKQGKPLANTDVEVFVAGAAKAMPAGKTSADGKIVYQPAAGSKGPAMFSVEAKDSAPTGAKYDAVNYSTALTVNW